MKTQSKQRQYGRIEAAEEEEEEQKTNRNGVEKNVVVAWTALFINQPSHRKVYMHGMEY